MTDYLAEILEIEDAIYDLIPHHWITLNELSMALTEYVRETRSLTLNGMGIVGCQIDELVRYFCLEYYKKVQSGAELDALERQFPKRKFQIAIVEEKSGWRVRKRIFKRLKDR